jgi:oligopeptidase A
MSEPDTQLADNPLVQTAGLPQFNLIEPDHVVPAVKYLLEQSEKQIASIEETLEPTWEGLLRPLEEMDLEWEYTWGPVGHLLSVKNTEAMREAHKTVLSEVVAFGLRAQQSQAIYKGLKDLRGGAEWETLDGPQRRIVERQLRSAEHAGVGLEGKAKERFNEIAEQLSKNSTDFSNHVLDATKAFALDITDLEDVEGWPESLKRVASQTYNQQKEEESTESDSENGPWRITLDLPSFLPFMQHSKRRNQREAIYRAYLTRASEGDLDNSGLIGQTLSLRRERAQLLGYDTFAELSLDSKMAPDVDAVQSMFDELLSASRPFAVQDLDEVKKCAADSGEKSPLQHWDVPFWSERLREQRFDFTDDQLRPFFPLPRVLDGLFGLSEKLFGITIEQMEEARVWHPDVRYFKVLNESGDTIASFYLDPYSRPQDKRGGAWMGGCLSRRRVKRELRLPVVHLCCNGTPPVGEQPSLMSFSEVETLFHEFGHGLQAMLTTVDYTDASGTSGIEWDAVELASQFMENWCYHRPTLMGMTAHVETGEPLPDDLFDKVVAARTYRSGSNMVRQLEFGMIDMALHHNHDPAGSESALDVRKRIAELTSVLPVLPEDRFLCGFGHIFSGGYAAGYYSYKWSEVLSADAFSAFEEAGLDNDTEVEQLGRKFRDTVLARGGGQHPMEVFVEFRGRKPNTGALLRHSGLTH